jgi:hypothetical protein
MSNIDQIIQVNINRESVGLTETGFGVPLILGEHTRTSEKVKTYFSLTEVSEDFQTSDLEYKKALALFSQAIKPEKIMIGKRSANVKQKVTISVPTVADSTTYSLTVNGEAFDFISGVGATADTIVDGLIASISAGNEPIVTTDNGATFDIEANVAGEGFSIVSSANLLITEVTANVNVVTELQAIQDVNDDFYFVILTSKSAFDILQLAAYIESQLKIFMALTNDANVAQSVAHIQTLTTDVDFVTANTIDLEIDGTGIAQVAFDTDQSTTMGLLAQAIQDSTAVETATVTGANEITITGSQLGVLVSLTNFVVAGGTQQAVATFATTQDPVADVGSKLLANSYSRTALTYTSNADNDIDAAWVGRLSGENPGSVNWSYTQLSGVVADDLSASVKNILFGKRVNSFTNVSGVSITEKGFVSSSPNFIDIIRGDDFTQVRLQEGLFSLLVASNKVPYTNDGLNIIRGKINEVIQVSINQGIYADSPAPVITIPTVAGISDADKETRVLKDITVDVVRSGAVNTVRLTVNVEI